jgi:hypothetical protein
LKIGHRFDHREQDGQRLSRLQVVLVTELFSGGDLSGKESEMVGDTCRSKWVPEVVVLYLDL